MRVLARKVAIVMLALWLPAQAAAAAAIPFCDHGMASGVAADHAAGASHSHDNHGPGSYDVHGGLCHLALASVLPSTVAIALPQVPSVPVVFSPGAFRSHVPEQRDPPPLFLFR